MSSMFKKKNVRLPPGGGGRKGHFRPAGLLSPGQAFHLGELNPFSSGPVALGGQVGESLGPEWAGTQLPGELS